MLLFLRIMSIQQLLKRIQILFPPGIGPLHHSPEYVIIGSPDERLKHDLKFIASKMNVQCPPLPIAHKHKKKNF